MKQSKAINQATATKLLERGIDPQTGEPLTEKTKEKETETKQSEAIDEATATKLLERGIDPRTGEPLVAEAIPKKSEPADACFFSREGPRIHKS